jgi:hypothetical protein
MKSPKAAHGDAMEAVSYLASILAQHKAPDSPSHPRRGATSGRHRSIIASDVSLRSRRSVSTVQIRSDFAKRFAGQSRGSSVLAIHLCRRTFAAKVDYC